MNDKSFEHEVISYYSEQRLAPDKLESLLEETQRIRSEQADAGIYQGSRYNAEQRASSKVRKALELGKTWVTLPLAGAVTAIAAIWFLQSGLLSLGGGEQKELLKIMFKEAAVNHLVKSELDYEEKDLGKLNESMARLDFDMQLPANIVKGYTLVGGRYCTVGGNLAVHLRFRPENQHVDGSLSTGEDASSMDETRSVFITRKTEALSGIKSADSSFENNLNVKSGQQGDLFLLVAQGMR